MMLMIDTSYDDDDTDDDDDQDDDYTDDNESDNNDTDDNDSYDDDSDDDDDVDDSDDDDSDDEVDRLQHHTIPASLPLSPDTGTISEGSLSTNGRLPVSSLNIVQPSDHQSTAVV